ERQHVAVPLEFVGRGTFTRFRRVAVDFMDLHRVSGHRVFAPNVRSIAIIKSNLERAISFERPYCAERICPSADDRRLSALLKHCAPCDQPETDDSQTE